MGSVTTLIQQARSGDRGAFDALFEALHPELRQIAHRRLSRNPRDGRDPDSGTTMLVHECYLKLVRRNDLTPADRDHFLAYVATAMRSIIVDRARAAAAERRGGVQHVPLETDVLDAAAAPADTILQVHAALDDLARVDPRLAQVVEMRYFGGLGDEDIARTLGVTDRTVRRDWSKARLLLAHALRN